MNYTFLPPQEKRTIMREYRMRAAIVLLFFISVSFVIGIGSLFPAYVNALFQEKLHLSDVSALRKTADAATFTTTQNDLAQSTTLMGALVGSITPAPFSTVIAQIASIRGAVRVSSFSIASSSSSLDITLSGLSPTRADLLAFQDRLKAIGPGVLVDLPISELAHDTDIQFSLKVTEPSL